MKNPNNKMIDNAKFSLVKKRKEIDDEYYRIIDNLEQVLTSYLVADINLDFVDLSVIRGWNHGAISTSNALKTMNSLNIESTAENVVTAGIKKLLAERGHFSTFVENEIQGSLAALSSNVVPLYVRYLRTFKFLLNKLNKIDKAQIKIIHGRSIEGGKTQIREIPLNQAIRFINSNKLYKREDRYIMCDYTVTFENKSLEDNKLKTTAIDWFLAPEPYVKIISDVFGVKSRHQVEDKVKFYQDLELAIRESK